MKTALYPILSVVTFASVVAPLLGAPPDKNIVSRIAEVDGVQLHYLTAGHGPAVILLHGYAETS